MVKRKPVRTRGKIPLSKYFQRLKVGDSVAITRERSLSVNFPTSLQGRTGSIIDKRGKAYIIKIKGRVKDKEYLIEPVHLTKIKDIKK